MFAAILLCCAMCGDGKAPESAAPADLKAYESARLKAGHDAGAARSPGPLVRGAWPDQETAGAPGTGGRPRPQERDGTRAPGTRLLQRTVDEAGRSGEANGVGPGLSGPDPRVYRPPRPDGRQGRCPDETGRVVHREGADGASQGALPRRGSPRPVAGARLAAPGLQEARKPLDQARGGGRREGRVRAAEARQPALEVASREAPRGLAEQPCSPAREGRAGAGGGHRSPCRADGLARLRHRRRAVATRGRERAEPHRRSSRFECAGDVGGVQPIGGREAAGAHRADRSRPARRRGPVDQPVRRPYKYTVRPGSGPGSTGELYVDGERFDLRRVYQFPTLDLRLFPVAMAAPRQPAGHQRGSARDWRQQPVSDGPDRWKPGRRLRRADAADGDAASDDVRGHGADDPERPGHPADPRQ